MYLSFIFPPQENIIFNFFFSVKGLQYVSQMKIKHEWKMVVQDHSSISIWFYHVKCNYTTCSNAWFTIDLCLLIFYAYISLFLKTAKSLTVRITSPTLLLWTMGNLKSMPVELVTAIISNWNKQIHVSFYYEIF